jgi:hypothetical protein
MEATQEYKTDAAATHATVDDEHLVHHNYVKEQGTQADEHDMFRMGKEQKLRVSAALSSSVNFN